MYVSVHAANLGDQFGNHELRKEWIPFLPLFWCCVTSYPIQFCLPHFDLFVFVCQYSPRLTIFPCFDSLNAHYMDDVDVESTTIA
jgi:hypothetical protein